MKIHIDRIRFKMLKKLAEIEKLNWDKKNGESQCKNTVESCLTGIIGEYAAKIHIYKTTNPEYIKHYGFQERLLNVDLKKCDIETEKLKVEVKTVRNIHPKGQIYPSHTKKYIKNKIDYVYFVEMKLNKDHTADCFVYLIEKPIEIEKWPLKPNLRGDLCYTSPLFPRLPSKN